MHWAPGFDRTVDSLPSYHVCNRDEREEERVCLTITFTTNVATVAAVAESGLAAIIVQIGQHFPRRDGSDSRRIEADGNMYTYTCCDYA